MTAYANAESAPKFELPSHRAFLRAAVIVGVCLSLLAGFVAQVSSAPSPAPVPANVQAVTPAPCVQAS